ncbi:MAG TPA: ABC transporter transmembrane domain-containing protein [Cyclobacteriaceae bacterium]|nr:ABC transporter transmembrane domain-containing protein [Cyclobacteriaceae bacterium]
MKETEQEIKRGRLGKEGITQLLGVFRFALPYKWIFAVGLVALILSSFTLLSFPYYAGRLLDLATGKPDPHFTSLNQVAGILVLVLFVLGIFSFLRVYTFSVVSERALADLRASVFGKMLALPMEFFDRHRAGELTSRIASDVQSLQETFTTTLAELLRQIITLLAGIALLFYLTPRLTLFMLATFPVLVILALVFGRFIRKLSGKTQDKLAASNVLVSEALQGIGIVKAFTNERLFLLRYRKALGEVVTAAVRSARYRGLLISFVIFVLFGGIVAVAWYGATLVQSGSMSVGDLFSFVLYTTFVGGSIAGLGDIYAQLQRAVGASGRLLELLGKDDEPGRGKREGKIRFHGEVEFDEVSFAYPTRPGVMVTNRMSFTIHAGETVALVGPSGAGKSTLINLLLRLYNPTDGCIRVDGQPAGSYELALYRENIGIVPQEVMLFGGTIYENIAFGKPGATRDEVVEAARLANALDFIEGFPDGFNTVVGDRGITLSGGQRQRIAIARAILKDPAILVLDEATSSLDAESEHLIQLALERLMEGRTTIVIAHRLSTIRKADRILVIDEGKLAEAGSHSELAARDQGIYQNLLRLQLQ